MFKRIGKPGATVTVYFDGTPIQARAQETVAACLMTANVTRFRNTPAKGTPRLPFCMIGHCFECLVEIDGQGNQQACLAIVREGMTINSQDGAPSVPGQACQ